MNVLNTWQFNLISYLVGIVVFFQFYKLAVRNAKSDGAATILLQLIAIAAIFFLVPFFSLKFPSDPKIYFFLIMASVFYALNDRLQTTCRKHLQVSVFSIIYQLRSVFLISIGLTVFNEPVVISKIIGAGLILLGNVLIFYKKGKFRLNKYIWLAAMTGFFFALALSIDVGISKQFNLPAYIMLTLLLPAVMIFFGERLKFSEILREYNSPERKYYLVTGSTWALMIFFSLRAFQFGKVTTIVPLQATSVLFNVIVAYFFLDEKKDELKKLLAACLIILGAYFTVLKG